MKLRKQHILIALAALAMMPGCNKFKFIADDMGDGYPTDDVPQSELQVISFGVSSPDIDVSTKSAGAVDAWSGKESLYIYGYNNRTKIYELNNVMVASPTSGTMVQPQVADGGFYYYNANNDIYDFYGYYVDDAYILPADATTDNGPVPTISTEDKKTVTLPLKINGSQDILLAETNKENDIAGTDVPSVDRLYSSYSARRKVVPTLTFRHLLMRFNFKIISGSAAGDDVLVKSITVKSQVEGTLTIVGDNPGLSVKTDGPTETLSLMRKEPDENGQLVPFELIGPNKTTATDGTWVKNPTPVEVGAGFYLFPDVESYVMTLTFQQGDNKNLTSEMPITLNASDVFVESSPDTVLDTFEEGKQYNITITIYGLENIKINAALSDWKAGGDIHYDPDNVWEELNYTGTNANGTTNVIIVASKGRSTPKPGDAVLINGAAATAGEYIVTDISGTEYTLVVDENSKVVSWTPVTTSDSGEDTGGESGEGEGTEGTEGDGTGDTEGDGTEGTEGEGTGDTSGESDEGDGTGDAEGDGTEDTEGDGTGDTEGDATGDTEGDGTGDTEGDGTGDTEGEGTGETNP